MSVGHGYLLRPPQDVPNSTFLPSARRSPDLNDRPVQYGAVVLAGVVQTSDQGRIETGLAEPLLSSYAARLRELVRARDVMRRIGPDRVAVACLGVTDWQELSALLERLHRSVSSPLPLPDGIGYATLSITGMLAQDAVERLLDLA